MPPKLRKYLTIVIVAVVLGFIVYELGHSGALKNFDWRMVAESVRNANVSLLLLVSAAVYVCYGLCPLGWMQFSHSLGRTHFLNVYNAILIGFTCLFLLGRPG